jgi:TPR repeat protein
MTFSKPLYSTLLFWFGFMLAVSGWAQDKKTEPYSAELVKRAEAGDVKAQNHLGWCYENGQGVAKDTNQAAKWFRKSVEHLSSDDLRKSADQTYQKASAGDSEAQYTCGSIAWAMKDDVAGQKDSLINEAISWYTKSAEQGNSKAQVNLGFMYLNGIGVEKDSGKAAKLFSAASEKDDAKAQYYFGQAYLHGDGIEKNENKSFVLFKKSAEQGHVDAQAQLGFAYSLGHGVEVNMAEALKWFKKASSKGSKISRKCIDLIEKDSSPKSEKMQITFGGGVRPVYNWDGTLKGYINRNGTVYDSNMDYKGWIGK